LKVHPKNDRKRRLLQPAFLLAGLCGLFLAAAMILAAAASDQRADDQVGVIDGDNLAINGPMSMESVAGQIKTILCSGSDVRVKGGQAKISLVEGGQISICGPAHLSLLKSGGTLTIALDNGVIHVRADREPALAIYTPQIQGNAVAVGDGPRDLLVGFESPSEMCIRTYRGALHVQQQLGDESIMIPQGGDVLLTNGQFQTLRNGEGHCHCELQIAKTAPQPPIPSPPASSSASSGAPPADEAARVLSPPSNEAPAASIETPAPKDDRVYQVEMPPLVYDASKKVQTEPDPRIMLIVRRVRVRPTLIFQGRVEAAPEKPSVAPDSAPNAAPATPANSSVKKAPAPTPSFSERVHSFFRSLWTHG
jgi:hypothetical protein